MKKARIWYKQNRHTYSIEVPVHVSQIKFSEFCDFRQLEAQYLNDEEMNPAEVAVLLKNAIGKIVSGELHPLPVNHEGDNPKEILNTSYRLGVGDPLSLNRIYAHLVTIIQEYAPDKIPQTFRTRLFGKKFIIQRDKVARILLDDPLTTGESLEVLEYQRRATKRMETSPKDTGNIDFNLGLRELAILVRQKGEELPAIRDERIRFINARMNLFKDVTLDIILDIRFFFASSLIGYTQKNLSYTFGKDLQATISRIKQTGSENVKQWLRKPGK